MVAKSFVAAVQQGSYDSWSRNQVYVQKKYDNYVEKQATSNNSDSPCLVKRNLELIDDDCLSFESNKSSFLARAVNIQIIHRLHSILENNGFTNFQIRYIRGRWVWIDLDAENDLYSFRLSVKMDKIFTEFKHIDKDFGTDERVVWIDIVEGIRVMADRKYYDVLINEFAYWAPDFEFEYDCESNESSESDCLDGKKSDTSSGPTVLRNVIWRNRCTSESIYNSNVRKKNNHTNITEIKEAMANNTINDGMEETKSSWPPGYTEDSNKKEKVRRILNKLTVNLVGLQETFMKTINLFSLRSICGRWLDVKPDIYMVNVYAPQDEEGKQNLWRFITEFVSNNLGHYIIFGDFNSVRNKSKRFGSVFSNSNAFYFNEFIANGNLVYIPMDSTWNHLGPLTAMALDQTISDHHPILLRRCTADYGPIPLKIYHSWFQADGFDKVMTDFWKQLSVRGIKSNGQWVEEPMAVKQTFLNHFSKTFSKVTSILYSARSNRFKMVSQHHLEILESEVSLEEIKEVVWDCGSDKSPGPDGFTFGFIKRYWNTMKNDIFVAISEFFNKGDFPIGCNASFVTLIPKIESPLVVNDFRPISLIEILYKIIAKIISYCIALIIDDIVDPVQSAFIKNRQILDGPMILNEVVHTLKMKKKKAMISKVDIAKAYDTLSWDYLISLECGLRQVDPLAPFLFILAMEGFHIAMEDAIEAKKFIGINIGDVCLSRLIYADDVIVFGEWSQFNLVKILDIFHCFYLASGLQISVMKSKLYAIGATKTKLNHLAGLAGCKGEKLPFLYLGLPIPVLGSLPTYYLSLFRMPRTICNKLEAMRSKFFWGAEDTNRKIHWVKWDLVLASKDCGGLGFGSLHSLNLALLYKWRWRFHNHHNALWAKIIKNLYPFSSEAQGWVQVRKQVGPWNNIMQTVSDLHNTSMVPISVMKRKIGDRMSTLFWHDVWINDTPLAQQFPRLFLLEEFKNARVGYRWNGSSFAWNWRRPLRGGTEDDQYHRICDIIKQVTIVQTGDSWRWSCDKIDLFSVNGLHKHRDSLALPSHYLATRWNKIVPRR
nr:RNA-directed DNA polymerase, eukaryota, reverse transcriptase zinc-binding domain protein [Tanacetum cinerariifolium]